MTLRICASCQLAEKSPHRIIGAAGDLLCKHELSMSLVTGAYSTCSAMRKSGACGRKGNLFVVKDKVK